MLTEAREHGPVSLCEAQLLRFAVFGGEVELDFAACALLGRVDDAGVEGARVHMQAYRALPEFAGVDDSMDRIAGIDRAGMSDIHFYCIQRLEARTALCNVLMHEVKVLDLQAAYGDSHPAILIAMIVDRTHLPDLPADGHQFVERRAIDEVARVVLAVPGQVGRERVGVDRSLLQKAADGFGDRESRLRHLPQAFDKFCDGNGLHGGKHGYA